MLQYRHKWNEDKKMVNVNNYKTIKEVASCYKPLFTESSIRQMIHKNTDGINACVFRIGGKVLINLSKFEQWFKERENS
jgi:hypothetical protein